MSERSSGGQYCGPQLRSLLQQADTHSLNSKDLPSVPEHTSGQPKQPLPCGHLDSEPEWEIPPSALSLGTVLGEGEFGIVHKGRWNGTPVAIKVIKAANPLHRSKIALEVDVLRRVRHPNVVQFLGASTRSDPVTIVSEVLEGGSLADALQTRPQPPLRRVLEIALDCARGLNCLHCASPAPIIHRDLKPDNVMLTRNTAGPQGDALTESGTAKLADFGLSRLCGEQSIISPPPPPPTPLPPPTPSHPRGVRTSGRSSLDVTTQQTAPGTPASSESSEDCHWVGYVDVDDTDDLFNPPVQEAGAPESLKARTSSADGGRPSTSDHSASAGASEGGQESYKMTGGTGSYAYMAGEILRHEPYNAAADVYSLAMVMYEMLSGRRPFAKLDPRDAARAAARDGLRPKWKAPPQTSTTADRAVLPEVQALVERCWAAAPSARPSCSTIIVELERLLSQLGPARPSPKSRSNSETRRRIGSLNVPIPARVVDSVQDMTSRTLSKFARGGPEPFTPRQRGRSVGTQPMDVPDSAPLPGSARGKLHGPLATGPASLPPLGSPLSGMSSPSPLSQGPPRQFRQRAAPERAVRESIPEAVLSSSLPGSASSMVERRKNFLDRLKWRVPKNRPSLQMRAEESSDSAMF